MDKNEVINYFMELVRIDSPSKNERKLADKLKQDLRSLGFQVEEDDTGSKVNGNAGNIIAHLKGSNAGKPTILLSAHMDTVSKIFGINPLVKDGKISSDGTTILSADDKAGICAIVQGIKSALEKGREHGDIEIVFTVCEEIGLKGSKNLNYEKLKAKMGFIFDSGEDVGKIVTSAPAQNSLYFKVTGKAAHAGAEPEKGISAIKVAGVALAEMNFGRIDAETTANIGVIKGGTATNIVTDLVEMEGESRSRSEEKLNRQTEHMVEVVKSAAKKYGAFVDCDVSLSYPLFRFKEDSPVVNYAVEAVRRAGLKPELISTGGGSDANIFNGRSIPCVNLASGFFDPHTFEEYIPVDSLVSLCKLVEALIE